MKGQDYRFENLSTACRDRGCYIEDVRWRSSVMDGCDYVFLKELDRILPALRSFPSLILCLRSFLFCFVSVCVCLLICSVPHRAFAHIVLYCIVLHLRHFSHITCIVATTSGSPCTLLRSVLIVGGLR